MSYNLGIKYLHKKYKSQLQRIRVGDKESLGLPLFLDTKNADDQRIFLLLKQYYLGETPKKELKNLLERMGVKEEKI